MTVTDGDILRIVASMLWSDGEVMQNVFNAVVTGGGSPWADQDIIDDAEAWLDNMYANITGDISTSLEGNEVVVYKYDAIDDDWDEVGSQAWTWTPTNANDQLPRGVAGLLNLQTVDPDVQGKKYIGGYTEGAIVNGLLGAAIITTLLAFGSDWLTPFVGGTSGASWAPGIWSVAQTVFKLAVSSLGTSTIMAYQRRRKRNVGI